MPGVIGEARHGCTPTALEENYGRYYIFTVEEKTEPLLRVKDSFAKQAYVVELDSIRIPPSTDEHIFLFPLPAIPPPSSPQVSGFVFGSPVC